MANTYDAAILTPGDPRDVLSTLRRRSVRAVVLAGDKIGRRQIGQASRFQLKTIDGRVMLACRVVIDEETELAAKEMFLDDGSAQVMLDSFPVRLDGWGITDHGE